MNYTQPGSQIRQSDEILRKLNQIKQSIQDHRDPSPDNLHQYLPQQRTNSNQYSKPRTNELSNPQSYRHSLEKKLQRLFKEERKVFNQKQERSQHQDDSFPNAQPFSKFDSKDAFTVEKMENKIKQLEKKYLSSGPASQQKLKPTKQNKQKDYSFRNNKPQKHSKFLNIQEENQTPLKKTKFISEKIDYLKEKERERTRKVVKIEDKSDKKLLTELDFLKKEIRQIKESNVELNEKMLVKQNDRKNKKERSRYLLRCILAKLIEIQEEVGRREKKEQRKSEKSSPIKGSLQERQSLIHENAVLIHQVQQLNKNLKKEIAEKERAQERSSWIENELRKLNRL